MSESVYLTTICLVLGTILIIFGIRYVSAMQYAKVRAASDSGNAATLTSIQDDLADIKTRLGTIEKILKDVG